MNRKKKLLLETKITFILGAFPFGSCKEQSLQSNINYRYTQKQKNHCNRVGVMAEKACVLPTSYVTTDITINCPRTSLWSPFM